MTIAYGIAQIVAPMITGLLREYNGDYSVGLYAAAAAMIVGSALMLIAKTREVSEKPTPGFVNQ